MWKDARLQIAKVGAISTKQKKHSSRNLLGGPNQNEKINYGQQNLSNFQNLTTTNRKLQRLKVETSQRGCHYKC